MLARLSSQIFEDGCPARATVRRMRLRHAALTYARHGWQVVAGSRLCGHRFKCGPTCATVACHPRHLPDAATLTTLAIDGHAMIRQEWQRAPHSVLLVTGEAFDVVEVPAYIGALAGDKLRGPVAVTPNGQWMFLVRPGEPLHPHLVGQRDVVLHGVGSWIPAPPVRTPLGTVRWVVAPQEIDWQIPDAREVQSILAAVLPWLGFPSGPPRVRAA
jgi:hypothetical protein